MDTLDFQKFCPVCKMGNNPHGIICRHCGALLGEDPMLPTTQRVDNGLGLSDEIKEQLTRQLPPPPEGLAVFVLGTAEAIATRTDEEFILGRAGEVISEPICDLTDLDAFAMGVSRRHALIRSTGNGYVLIDLNSSNGTWLNGQRLVPTRIYELPSGAVITLGRLKLVAIYLHTPNKSNHNQ
jgi:pSer/pThr/pTyr-binding forkhead associated (FHA) protein